MSEFYKDTHGSQKQPGSEGCEPTFPGAMVTIRSILDQSRALAELTMKLADRIGGQNPEEGTTCGQLQPDPLSNLTTAVTAIERELDRAQVNLSRASDALGEGA